MSNADMTVEDMAMGERKFLHDISNQLVIAQGMSSFLKKALDKNENVSEKERERMLKIEKSVKELITLVKERRALLHSLTENNEPS